MRGEFERSDYVGIVRVLGVTWLDEARKPTKLHRPLMLGTIPGDFDPYSGANYRVATEHTLKGRPRLGLTIFSENTEARTPLRVGARYLVFLERQTVADEDRRVGDLMIDYCGNSAMLSHAGRALWIIQNAPDYESLEAFLRAYVRSQSVESGEPTRYAAAFVDLNGDRQAEVVVYLSGGGWCGSGGCTTLILKRNGDDFRVVTRITISRLPILILPTASHGWRDIIISVAGGGVEPGGEVALSFDSHTYPTNPTMPPAKPVVRARGRVLISEDSVGRPLADQRGGHDH